MTPPTVDRYATEAELIVALKALYQEAASEPLRFAICRVFVFSGQQLVIAGDPVRGITLPNGNFVSLVPDNAPTHDDPTAGWLLPASVRPIKTPAQIPAQS